MASNFDGTVTLYSSMEDFEGPEVRPVRFTLELGADGRTLTVTAFEPVVIDLESNPVELTVTMTGQGRGQLDPDTGAVELAVDFLFHFEPDFLAAPSTLALALTTETKKKPDGQPMSGAPLVAGQPALKLVGSGVFDEGALDAELCGTVIEGTLQPLLH